MAGGQLSHVLRHIRALVGAAPAGDTSDGSLLARFAAERDQDAFTELVRRHGPLVWSVCRRVLYHEQDAEDAFQAVFLVLARKAGAGGWQASVAGWLYETARRTAQKAQIAAERRRQREREAGAMRQTEPDSEVERQEQREALSAELARLPAHYREPLLLCDLEGLTHEDAARRLGCPAGTVKSGLARGRDNLRARLLRRGLTLSAAGLTGLLTQEATAAPPRLLADNTITAALLLATGRLGTSAAWLLAREVYRTTLIFPIRIAVGILLAVGIVFAYGLSATNPQPAVESSEPQAEEQKPRTDRYGDPLPDGAVARLGTVRFREPYTHFYAVNFSPDGQSLAAINDQGRVSVWSMATGRIIRECAPKDVNGIPQSASDVHAFVAFSPDSKQVLAGMNRSNLCQPLFLWDIDSGDKVRRMEGAGQGFIAAAVSADFKTLAAVGQDRRISFWEVASGKLLRQGAILQDLLLTLAFAPDAKTLATGGPDGLVRQWDVTTARELRQFEGHGSPVSAIAMAPSGKTFATAAHDRGFILWDVATGQPIRKWRAEADAGRRPPDSHVYALAFSPDNTRLAAVDRGSTVDVWDPSTGQRLHRFRGEYEHFLAFSPDGKTLAAGGGAAIGLWDVGTGKPSYASHRNGVSAIWFSPDGRSVMTSGGGVYRWEAATGKLLHALELDSYAPALSPDGRFVADRDWDGTLLRIYAADDGRELSSHRTNTPNVPLALSRGGKILAVRRGRENALALLDADSGKERPKLASFGPLMSSAVFSPDGRLLAAAGFGGGSGVALLSLCRVWDTGNGRVLHNLSLPGRCRSLAFSPDGRFLAGCSWEGSVALWEIASGQVVCSSKGLGVGLGLMDQVAVAPYGQTIAASGREERQNAFIWLWDGESGMELRFIRLTDPDPIVALAFTPDGHRLASGNSYGRAVLIWDLSRVLAAASPVETHLDEDQLKALWRSLGDNDIVKARRAVQTFSQSPADAREFLSARLAELTLRPQGAETKRLAQLLADLDSEEFAVREKASGELVQMGTAIAPALRDKLDDPRLSAEARTRIRRALAAIGDKDSVPAAEVLGLRVIEVLERLGTPGARRALEKAASGAPEARLTREAKAALDRLSRKAHRD
jgi:RNA polymerase sigma factor (sigma-70 family)